MHSPITWLLPLLLLPFLPAQEAAPASREAATLPPALRFVDGERAARSERLEQQSTAGLNGKLEYRMEWSPAEGDRPDRFVLGLQARVAVPGDLVLCMPAWRPGSYQIVDYGKKLLDLTAEQGGRALTVEPLETNLWRIAGAGKGPVELAWALEAAQFKTRSRDQDAPPGYHFHAPALWPHELRHKQLPITVEVALPRDWEVATGLEGKGTQRRGRRPTLHRFAAADYDELVDCPILCGELELFDFRVRRKRYEVAIWGKDGTDRQEFAERLGRICEHFDEMFGGVPFDRYVFLLQVGGFGGGGLEHRNSTSISVGNLAGSRADRKSMADSVLAHEFFHLWNVKRLRPVALGPFDYTGPNRTTALWFCEGITSYYGNKSLAQTGLISPETWWSGLAGAFSRLRSDAARTRMSIADVSWTVWDGPYMARRGVVSYYLKGECLGFLLDVLIRDGSDNRHSLDELMRRLYDRCEQGGAGFAEDDIRELASELAGRRLDDFFDAYVYGTEDLPIETVLPKAGMKLEEGEARGRRVRFGFVEDPQAPEAARKIREALVAPLRRGRR